MKKLLITGGSGFLGWHCCMQLPTGWKAFATFHENKEGIYENTIAYQVDLTDKDAIWRVMKEVKPDAVFHLAAHSGTAHCEKEPEATYPLNVTACANLAEMCADLKSKLLFTSSEQVFDGEKGYYEEKDRPNPKNEYGKQKMEAENRIQEIYPESATVRIAVLFGQASHAANSFFNQWIEAWENLLTVTAFEDEIRSFLSGGSCARALFHLLEQGAEGLFHLGGSAAMSRYEFGLLAKEIFKIDFAKIEGKSQKEVDMLAFRPPNLSLDCQLIKSIGFNPAHPADEMKKMRPYLDITPSISLN